jgi:Xaa-Pro dipeptidase
MVALGDPGKERREAYRTVREITAQVIDRVGPGVPVAQLVDMARSLLATHGRVPGNASRIGHGLGLDLTEPPSVLETDHAVLEPAMVIALEPAIGFEAGYFVTEENLVVTDEGHRLISPPGPEYLPQVD